MALKIRNCRKVMSDWKRKNRLNAKNKINQLQERLEWFQSKPYSCWFVINNLEKELLLAYKEEENFWWQKSREKWLKLGDRNSNLMKSNRSKNSLMKLIDKNGVEQFSDAAKSRCS